MRAPKVCATPGCPNIQPCPDHERKPWAGSTRAKRLPKDWHRRRRTILRRDPLCLCGRPATEVHHTGRSDDHRLESLQGLCADCHRTETQTQANAARRA